jgi:hypothetical protein
MADHDELAYHKADAAIILARAAGVLPAALQRAAALLRDGRQISGQRSKAPGVTAMHPAIDTVHREPAVVH